MIGQVSIVQKDFDNCHCKRCGLISVRDVHNVPMALEYLACYLVPARGCGNKLKPYFRHLAGSREEGRSISPSVPEEGDDAQLYLVRMTFDIPKEMNYLGCVVSQLLEMWRWRTYLQHLLIAAVLNMIRTKDTQTQSA
jgi:hypothetical protein